MSADKRRAGMDSNEKPPMDPNENLRKQLEEARGIREVNECPDACASEDLVGRALALGPLVLALDEHLAAGGIPPSRWTGKATETRGAKTYVVIVTGYEGIDQLVWAGMDHEEAVRRVLALRDRIAKAVARYKELQEPVNRLCDAVAEAPDQEEATRLWNEADQRMFETMEAEFGKAWTDVAYGTSDHVCVQVYEPEKDAVRCCCGELGVGPSKPMFR